MQTFARKLNLIALALGAALTAPGCATDWFSSSSSDYVAGELSQDVENLPDPNAPPAPPKRPTLVSPLGAPFRESPDRLLLQANAYFEQGKFHDSARLYQKYLATPEAATAPPTVLGQAHYRIAVVARKKMNFAEAKREFEIALRYEPQNQQYRFDLGKSAFDGADYATADAAFSALIAQNPNYPQAQYYYGLTLLEGTRRAEAIAPLTKAVGELEAAALLTDKYYALGEAENAAAWEAQTTQIAARLGRPVPAFPNKPAFATASQPQAPTQIAPTPQTQAPAQIAPAPQMQAPAQIAPATQPQAPAQIAPATQTQAPAQIAPTTQTQAPAQTAPVAQPQAPAQIAPTTQTQAPASQFELPPTAQAPRPNVPDAQLQGPAPFVATVAPPIFVEKAVSSVEPLAVAPLDNANSVDLEARSLADATSKAQTEQNNAQAPISETLVSQTAEMVAPSPAPVDQNAEITENAEGLTAHIGRGNPGLFAATSAVETGFRPGSISTTAPSTAQTAQEPQIAQTLPNAQTAQESQIAQNPPFIGPRLPEPPRFDVETSFRRVALFVELENCVAEYFAPLAPIYETAPSPFQVADAQALYAAAPSPSDLAVDEDEEFDENDDFAFASSGTPQTPVASAPPATIGGFGSYQAPTFDATPADVQPFAQASQTPQIPLVSQNAPTTQTPFISQNAPTTQTPFVPQNAQTAQIPQVAQNAPTVVSQYAAPNAVPRRTATPEERLQAAIAAGAEVREISPEEYRRAVSVGLSGQTQPR